MTLNAFLILLVVIPIGVLLLNASIKAQGRKRRDVLHQETARRARDLAESTASGFEEHSSRKGTVARKYSTATPTRRRDTDEDDILSPLNPVGLHMLMQTEIESRPKTTPDKEQPSAPAKCTSDAASSTDDSTRQSGGYGSSSGSYDSSSSSSSSDSGGSCGGGD